MLTVEDVWHFGDRSNAMNYAQTFWLTKNCFMLAVKTAALDG